LGSGGFPSPSVGVLNNSYERAESLLSLDTRGCDVTLATPPIVDFVNALRLFECRLPKNGPAETLDSLMVRLRNTLGASSGVIALDALLALDVRDRVDKGVSGVSGSLAIEAVESAELRSAAVWGMAGGCDAD
jgi:hypothetical protein